MSPDWLWGVSAATCFWLACWQLQLLLGCAPTDWWLVPIMVEEFVCAAGLNGRPGTEPWHLGNELPTTIQVVSLLFHYGFTIMALLFHYCFTIISLLIHYYVTIMSLSFH